MPVPIQQTQNQEITLHRLLRQLAAGPDLTEALPQLLDAICELTAADGILVMLADDLQISVGNLTAIPQDPQLLSGLVADLNLGLNIDPHILNNHPAEEGHHILIRLLPSHNQGLLWITHARSPLPAIEERLQPLLDLVQIAASNLYAQRIAQYLHYVTTSIMSSIADPLFVLDDTRSVQLMNPVAEKLFGTSSDVAAGQPLAHIVDSHDLLQLAQGENRNLKEWTSPDGQTFIPRMMETRDSAGAIDGYVLIMRDITHFKKLNRNQSEFTRIVSHDLRSPLTSMQGFANMLELGLVGELNERQGHFVEKILSGISQMTALVDNIQDAGRYDPETGFYEISRSPCDLCEIVQRIVNNHLMPAEKQELSLTVETSVNIPVINADATMIERAITNLVDNAIKYTPNGGRVNVAINRDADNLIISVSDTGLGISPEHQKQLFERHVRIPRKEHKKIKGSGLGLFIVRSVAQRHGGDAWVSSAEGSGSTFYINIPLTGDNLLTSAE